MEDEKRRTEDISASKKKDADEIKRLKADKEGLSREVDELKDAVNKVGSVVSSSYSSFDSFLSLFIFLQITTTTFFSVSPAVIISIIFLIIIFIIIVTTILPPPSSSSSLLYIFFYPLLSFEKNISFRKSSARFVVML